MAVVGSVFFWFPHVLHWFFLRHVFAVTLWLLGRSVDWVVGVLLAWLLGWAAGSSVGLLVGLWNWQLASCLHWSQRWRYFEPMVFMEE